MSAVWQARLLGEFSLVCDDRSITETITGRSQALLAYLMLHRHTPQPRQRLAFHLWTESTDTQARTNLRKELSYLRRALPHLDQVLLIDAKALHWQPKIAFELDVAQFEEAIQSAQELGLMQHSARETTQTALEQAVGLYRGDLLPDCDDEWVIPERERFQQMHIRALEQLINLLKEQQNYRPALDYAQRLLRIAPLNEATYCTLMQLHALSGDRANALQVYHHCMTVLREELGVDPSSTTRKLHEQLLLKDEFSPDKALDKAPVSLALRPFDREKTAELIRSVNAVNGSSDGFSAVSDNVLNLSLEEIDQVFIDSGGNPLYALEIARALSIALQNHSVSHTVNLEALIGDRLQQLDNAVREFLSWAAALGRSFKPTKVAQVADYPVSHLLTAIEQLERQNIIRSSTDIGNESGTDCPVQFRLQQPGADVALKQAIVTLHQIDARRMLSYVLIGAAETDLECQRLKLAVHRVEAALQAAQSIKHPSVTALAWAISIWGGVALGEQDQVVQR